MAIKYGGEQFWVTSFDGRKLDCMLIKAEDKATTIDGFAMRADLKFERATVLFCNPNACFYEYLHYQTEWIDYYYQLGVNVVIWNYREYSRSGKPAGFFQSLSSFFCSSISPTAIMRDGEKVCQYVKSNIS